jgi:uncharacterized RDD family membrane protein YckC
MEWSDELRMETPEQIELDLELAGVGSRFLAVLVDWLLKLLLTLVVGIPVVVVVGVLGGGKALDNPSKMLIAVVIAGLYLLWLGYSIYFEVKWNGQTPGKWVVGIRVIREGGAPVDFRAAAVRNLLATADFLPTLFLLGALLVVLTSRRQRLGDMAAGTIVVRERAATLGADPIEELTRYATDEYTFTRAQLAQLTAADRTVIREFLRRDESMSQGNADRLALTLAEKLAKKMGPPVPDSFRDGEDARRFLASLLRDLEALRRHG